MSPSVHSSASVESDSKLESQDDPVPTLDKNASGYPKLDKHGLPLIPQPSDDPSDPLNWPQWLKIAILLQVSAVALIGPLNQAVINPAYVPLAAKFHKTIVEASYQTVIALAFSGIGAFLWVPLANTYGRRPVLLLSLLISAASSLGSGKAETWSQLIAARVFNGIGTSSLYTLGAAVATDTFFLHERGRAMGIFSVCLSNSAHLAPIPGGFLGQYVSYRWCYYLAAILDFTMFVVMFFCFPETLYLRGSEPVSTKYPILRKMFKTRPRGKNLKLGDFLRPFEMFKYLAVTMPGWFFAYTFAISSILPAVTSANLFKRLYNFTTSQTGLALGGGTLIGSCLGELFGGIVIDRLLESSRKKKGDAEIVPEVKLQGIWPGAILVPVGIMVWGFCVQYETRYIGPVFGFGLTCFAVQIISTVLYSYCSDCYKPQTPEVAQIFNFGRQTMGMTVGFWAIPFGDRIGYHLVAVVLAIISVVSFLPIIYLMKAGKSLRARQGVPNFNKNI